METLSLIYVIGYFVSFPLLVGMTFAKFDTEFPSGRWGANSDDDWRPHLRFAILWGFCAAFLWPVFLLGTYFLTGFARHGIRFTPRRVKERR